MVNETETWSTKDSYEKAIEQAQHNQLDTLGKLYYDYGVWLFDQSAYASALDNLVASYGHGYCRESTLEQIYNCYLLPNEEEFKENFYETSLDCRQGEDHIKYESLLIDFIPLEENTYYIFDKETKTFKGIFDLNYFFEKHEINKTLGDECSNIVMALEWNWNEFREYLYLAKDRICYFIGADFNRMLSFLKVPQIKTICKEIKLFSSQKEFQNYFHNNTSVYLPKLLFGDKQQIEKIEKIVSSEHVFRCTPEGRSTENVLLSICIPSFDRGNLALQRIKSLLFSMYDAEIEFVVSNSGSQYYKEEYQEIEKIKDARIVYYAFEHNKGFVCNWHKTAELANGKFFILVSDEDDIIISNLGHYLNTLERYPHIGILRSGTTQNYCNLTDAYAPAGISALKMFFLNNNYMSGIIYKREKFIQNNFLKWEELYKNNTAYQAYPHMWWDACMAMQNAFLCDPIFTCYEGDSILTEQIKNYRENGSNSITVEEMAEKNNYPRYALYEERLKQHVGFIDLINLLPISNSQDQYIIYNKLCEKTYYLICLYIRECRKFDYDFTGIGSAYIQCCREGLNKLRMKELEWEITCQEIIDCLGGNIDVIGE